MLNAADVGRASRNSASVASGRAAISAASRASWSAKTRRRNFVCIRGAIEPVVVACVFEEVEPELTRVSLRSKSDRVNVSVVAGQFGGGGHPAAAGARIPGKPLAVQRRVIAAIKTALDTAKGS